MRDHPCLRDDMLSSFVSSEWVQAGNQMEREPWQPFFSNEVPAFEQTPTHKAAPRADHPCPGIDHHCCVRLHAGTVCILLADDQ